MYKSVLPSVLQKAYKKRFIHSVHLAKRLHRCKTNRLSVHLQHVQLQHVQTNVQTQQTVHRALCGQLPGCGLLHDIRRLLFQYFPSIQIFVFGRSLGVLISDGYLRISVIALTMVRVFNDCMIGYWYIGSIGGWPSQNTRDTVICFGSQLANWHFNCKLTIANWYTSGLLWYFFLLKTRKPLLVSEIVQKQKLFVKFKKTKFLYPSPDWHSNLKIGIMD